MQHVTWCSIETRLLFSRFAALHFHVNNHASITQRGDLAMDIWENGRQELAEELKRVCDRIGVNLAAGINNTSPYNMILTDIPPELDHDNNAIIPREKLKALREKAAKADEFEDEVSVLVRQKRELEARLSDVGEKNAEINRLVEDNARLAEELETHKSTSLRVDGLEKENKRLATELKQSLSHARDGKTPGSSSFRTPIPPASEPPSSASRTDANGNQVVAKDVYETLVRKFNRLYENHKELSSAREKIEKALIAKKEELKKARDDYDNNHDILEKRVRKRDATIEQHDKEIQRLRALVQDLNGGSHMLLDLEMVPKSREDREAQNLEEMSTALKFASAGPIQYAGRFLSFEDIVRALSPTPNEILEGFRSSRASTSSPTKGVSTVSHTLLESEHGSGQDISRVSSKVQDNRAPYELPMLLPGGDNGSDYRVVETEFEALEPHHTSATSELLPHKSSKEFRAPEIKQEPFTDAPPSPDTPVVISSRSLRKTKGRKDTIESNKVPRVKPEIMSSSPIGLAALHALDESIDLDDIGDKQITPRKGRPFLQQALANAARNETQSQHTYSNNSSNSQVSQETPIRRTGVKRRSSVLQPRSPNAHILPRTSAERTQKRRRVASDQAISDVIEDGQVMLSIEKTSRRKNQPTPEHAKLLGDLLAKASPPKHALSPARSTPIQPKSRRTRGGSAVSSRAYEVPQDDTPNDANFGLTLSKESTISKESAGSPRPTSKGSVPSLREIPRPSSKGCSLRGSVEPPRPTSRGTFRDSAYESRPTSRHSPETGLGSSIHFKPSLKTLAQAQRPPSMDLLGHSVEPQRPSPKGMSGQPKALNSALQAAQSRSRESAGTPSRPGIQPLRTRPLNELTLQDFKVNPKSNQGYGYAFREVVRKQADRRCLPGCTKPECCGNQFRVLAEATRNPNKTPTASQEEADEKILNEFLGDNSYKLRNMTEAEKHETLMQALTRDMANKVGKHRHAYERRQSPPGYWRSDFPNTQEQAEDRAKAEQVQREELTHRYEEAMRGGAYIFRDE